MKTYKTFTRTWWKTDKATGKLVPHCGRKTIVRKGLTYSEARLMCSNYNDTHNPGKLSRKMEFETE